MAGAESNWIERRGLRLTWAARTDVGHVRELNEDSVLAESGIFAVADGMGGHDAGDIASAIAIHTLRESAHADGRTLDDVDAVIAEANARIHAHSRARGAATMGTTLVCAIAFDNGGEEALVVANVGDSRCYIREAAGAVAQLTRDHSVVAELIERGAISEAEAAEHPQRHVVTRALGVEPAVAVDYHVVPRIDGSRLLLCSDGVSGHVDGAVLSEELARSPGPSEAVDSLMALVLAGRAPDNATAIVIDVTVEPVTDTDRVDLDDDITADRPGSCADAFADTAPTDSLIDVVPLDDHADVCILGPAESTDGVRA